jgi:hypothetical protein
MPLSIVRNDITKVAADAEALLYVEELATHEATREGYAA